MEGKKRGREKQLYSPHNWLVINPTENFTVQAVSQGREISAFAPVGQIIDELGQWFLGENTKVEADEEFQVTQVIQRTIQSL